MSSSLQTIGYKQSQNDHSLFIKKTDSHFPTLFVYIDDLILAGTDSNEINMVKKFLDDKFKIKDLGSLKYFLGLEVARSKSGITICKESMLWMFFLMLVS